MIATLASVIQLSLTYPHVPDEAQMNNHQVSCLPVIEFLHNFLGSWENSCFTFSYDPTTSRKILLQTTSCQLEWTRHLSATVFLTSEILDFLGKSLSVYVLPEKLFFVVFFLLSRTKILPLELKYKLLSNILLIRCKLHAAAVTIWHIWQYAKYFGIIF